MRMETLLDQSLGLIAPAVLILLILITGMGYRIGKRRGKAASDTEKLEKTAGTIAGAMLALLGFILAIALSMADSHFEARRKLVLDEANAIGTARLRALAIGGENGTQIVRLLIDYTRLRIEFFAAGNDHGRLNTVYAKTSDLQQRIWQEASTISRSNPTPISSLLLSSLNDVFDLASTRRWAFEVRVPSYIINLLLLFSLLAMGMMGYYFGICGVHHPILSLLLFLAFTIAIMLVMDLNRPRSGLLKAEQSPMNWLLEDALQPEPK
jgi:hypothetical protein